MAEYQKGSHTTYDIKYHLVWVTKYRYQVLKDEIALRLRELIRQSCLSRGITIIKGSVGKEHIHLLIGCPPQLAPSKIAQYLKGRSSRLLQEEFPHLKKRYWGQHLWARGYFCATVGTVTDELIDEYIGKTGETPPPRLLERMATYILKADTVKKYRHKHSTDYKVLSNRQLKNSQKGKGDTSERLEQPG